MSALENGVAAGVPAKFLVRCQSQTKEFGLMNLLRWTLIEDERRFGSRDKVEIQLCIYCVRVVITFHLMQNRFLLSSRNHVAILAKQILMSLLFFEMN